MIIIKKWYLTNILNTFGTVLLPIYEHFFYGTQVGTNIQPNPPIFCYEQNRAVPLLFLILKLFIFYNMNVICLYGKCNRGSGVQCPRWRRFFFDRSKNWYGERGEKMFSSHSRGLYKEIGMNRHLIFNSTNLSLNNTD